MIDLTEEDPIPKPGGTPAPDISAPIRRGVWFGLRIRSTPPYLTLSPEPRRIVIAEDGDDGSTPQESSLPSVVHPQIRSPTPVETRLLSQIPKEGIEEPVLPAPVVVRKRPLHSKPQAKYFKRNSRKGKRRIANLANFHLPFGYEPLPKVDLGTLDDALRKLGVDI